MTPNKKRQLEDPGDEPGLKRSARDIIRLWTRHCGFKLEDAVRVIETSGPDMSVPENLVRYIREGKLNLVLCVYGGVVVGAAIYGVYKAGDPPKNYPHHHLHRSQLYFVGVASKGRGVGSKLLNHFEEQSRISGVEVLQIVPAKDHLIRSFYRSYQVDQILPGGAFLSKRIHKPPPPTPLQPTSAANTPPPKPWNSFLTSLKQPANPPPAPVKTEQKAQSGQWASFMSALKTQGGNENGQERTKKSAGEDAAVEEATEKSGYAKEESVIEDEDDREGIHSDASGYWGSESSVDGGLHSEEGEQLDGNVLAGLDTGTTAGTALGDFVDGVESMESELGGYGGSRDTDGAAWDTEDLLDDADSQGIVGIASFLSAGVAQGARMLRSWWGC